MYKVAKGGAITINSFLNENDRNIARDYIIKTASSNMREAAKIGLQSLYADPKEVLEKYKDFDIVKEMQARKGAKLLWVRARAIDADVVNANGDLFSKEELLKEVEIKGQKIPSYKTFETTKMMILNKLRVWLFMQNGMKRKIVYIVLSL
jgi:hypothetical protein